MNGKRLKNVCLSAIRNEAWELAELNSVILNYFPCFNIYDGPAAECVYKTEKDFEPFKRRVMWSSFKSIMLFRRSTKCEAMESGASIIMNPFCYTFKGERR